MGKYAAYGIELQVGAAQVETVVIVVDGPTFLLTGSGNADVTVTHAGMVGSGVAKSVALLIGDTADDCATKIAAHLNAIPDVTNHMTITVSGPNITFRLLEGEANDGTFNIAYADDTCAGLTDDATSTDTTAGVDAVEVAGVTGISGPGLSLDTADVTSHDQATAWEQQVATVIRSSEVSLDIIYDPASGTHDATTGLLERIENRTYTYFNLIFFTTYDWKFFGYVTGFEPTGEIGSALTASAKVKITEAPSLE